MPEVMFTKKTNCFAKNEAFPKQPVPRLYLRTKPSYKKDVQKESFSHVFFPSIDNYLITIVR